MRLRTIWTLPAMSLRERLSRTAEWSWMWAAVYMPKKLRYWGIIMTAAKFEENPADVPAKDLMESIYPTRSA